MGRERWLLTGATGRLGSALRRHWDAIGLDADVLCAGAVSDDGNGVDLTDPVALGGLLARTRPTRILHCAGIARPHAAHAAPLAAARLHVGATRCMADAMRASGGWMLHCSTDFVFAGDAPGRRSEEDEALPRSYYGFTKLAGEQAVLDRGAGLVVRLSGLYDVDGKVANGSGWDMLLDRMRRDEPVGGVIDEVRTPLRTEDAADWLTRLALDDRRGLVHMGGREAVSPFLLLRRVAREIGSRSVVRPIRRADLGTVVERPRNVALDTRRLHRWLSAGTGPELDLAA